MDLFVSHKRNISTFILLFTVLTFFTLPSCSSDNEEELYAVEGEPTCDELTSFTTCVTPVLASCSSFCHNSDNAFGGVVLETYEEIKEQVDNSALANVLRGTNDYSIMPPTGMLPDADVELIEKWISEGAENN